MKARVRFYIPPLIISFITLMYLVFLIYYDWAISDYQPLNQVLKDMIARNGLEVIGVFVWFIFLLITSIITPILLVDIFSGKLPKIIFKKTLFKKGTNN